MGETKMRSEAEVRARLKKPKPWLWSVSYEELMLGGGGEVHHSIVGEKKGGARNERVRGT